MTSPSTTDSVALTPEQRKLFRIVIAPWIGKDKTFEEWADACDKLFPPKQKAAQ